MTDSDARKTMRRLAAQPVARALVALLLLTSWMTALFVGWTLGGLVYVLLVAALVVWPWNASAARMEAGDQS